VEEILPFLIVLFLVAAVLRDQFVFTILYLFAGVYILGRWWSGQSLKALVFQRSFAPRAFQGEEVPVRLEINNRGLLPAPWLRLHDSLPVELTVSGSFKRVISLPPYGKEVFNYNLKTRKRGYYQVGPLVASSGDIFGISGERDLYGPTNYLTVYPKTYILTSLELPSRSPMGTLRHHQPVFEDPSRVRGKRDYVAGDSLRRIDWKASAVAGRLQVKQFEPSIALETVLFLNLNAAEYDIRARYDATELAIIVAASIANWVISKKQNAGLCTNGVDPFSAPKPVDEDQSLASTASPISAGPPERKLKVIQSLPPRKGQGHLMRLLEVLARVEAAETISFLNFVRRESVHLAWGTTLILITGNAQDALFDELFQLRRSGLDIVLILVGKVAHAQEARQRARQFSFPFYHIRNELELDIWRR
jgi:uncharacterized protein (DUF58 family)